MLWAYNAHVHRCLTLMRYLTSDHQWILRSARTHLLRMLSPAVFCIVQISVLCSIKSHNTLTIKSCTNYYWCLTNNFKYNKIWTIIVNEVSLSHLFIKQACANKQRQLFHTDIHSNIHTWCNPHSLISCHPYMKNSLPWSRRGRPTYGR